MAETIELNDFKDLENRSEEGECEDEYEETETIIDDLLNNDGLNDDLSSLEKEENIEFEDDKPHRQKIFIELTEVLRKWLILLKTTLVLPSRNLRISRSPGRCRCIHCENNCDCGGSREKGIFQTEKGLGAVGKALASLEKNVLSILVPTINILATALPGGAKAGLAEEIYVNIPKLTADTVLAPDSISLVFDLKSKNEKSYLPEQSWKAVAEKIEICMSGEKIYDNNGESLLEVYNNLWLSKKLRDDIVEDRIASEAMRKKTSKDDAANAEA
ncbi:Hypothetical predicted protein [Paramuricea clavata]|uniref:Uncharacterized protein n=1 Tax=Paramuricea clavata TaxID=317549 RepID=A0A7D9JIE5_PARCT|nr:Hypothetical predicted protein [Paramuricea clavata]